MKPGLVCSQNAVLAEHGAELQELVMDPCPVVHLIVCYLSTIYQWEEFHTFLEFLGI